jgi:RNA polymerase II subunit A small phosphatase-like protein
VDGNFQEKILIFDVDETLTHATETPLAIALSFRTGPYSVYQRPFVGDFRAIEK